MRGGMPRGGGAARHESEKPRRGAARHASGAGPCRGAACAGHRSDHRGGRREARGVRAPPALHGDVGFPVRAARDAPGGALRRVVIPPGAPWRFHVAVGDPSGIPLRVVGGRCDLVRRSVPAARRVTPPRRTTGVGCAAVAAAAALRIVAVAASPGDSSRIIVRATVGRAAGRRGVRRAGRAGSACAAPGGAIQGRPDPGKSGWRGSVGPGASGAVLEAPLGAPGAPGGAAPDRSRPHPPPRAGMGARRPAPDHCAAASGAAAPSAH